MVFDPSFINNEISQADNIKDKNNKKSVVRVLKMINNKMKLLMIPENGILLFVGIDQYNNEISEIMIPPNPIKEFYNSCNKKFETFRFEHLFEQKSLGHVVFISGNECLIYKYDGKFKKIKTLNANLIKRQSKGGQSSVRFSRLAEESRHHYIVAVSDYLNKTINTDINWLFGSNELKNMLLNYNSLKIKFRTDTMFFTFNDITINNQYFEQLMVKSNEKEQMQIENIVELINRNPDFLLFSEKEIDDNLNNIEYIIDISQNYKNENIQVIKLNIDNKYYGQLKNFKILAKLYYI